MIIFENVELTDSLQIPRKPSEKGCCADDYGGSHWHCGVCDQSTSMMGCYSKDPLHNLCLRAQDYRRRQTRKILFSDIP